MQPTNENGTGPKKQPDSDMRYVLIDIERQSKMYNHWRFRIGTGMATLILILLLILRGVPLPDIQTVLHWLRSLF